MFKYLFSSIFIFSLISVSSISFGQEISQDWTSFTQSVDASFVKEQMKFRVTANVRVETTDAGAWAGVWARVDNKGGGSGFFDNMGDRKIRSSEWRTYVVEGLLDENSDKVFFGGLCSNNGKFYFDNFDFQVQNKDGKFISIDVENPGFERKVIEKKIPGWTNGIGRRQVTVKGFDLTSSTNSYGGKLALLIEGSGIAKDTSYLIGPIPGFSPQIGTLLTMLNNMTSRIESVVQSMNQEDLDWLFDENANSVGALLKHLIATEIYYQNYTFEGRGFNEEEAEWSEALNLGEQARQNIKGNDAKYYLDIFKKVREKTIEEFKKRDDEWLAEELSDGVNNHFAWFHVMEHQSSHLGQILMLRKRIPVKEEIKEIKPEQIKSDY